MSKITRMPQALREADNVVLFDDFTWFVSAHQWTSTLTDAGTAAVTAGTTNLLLTPSDGTVADNDETYVATTAAVFKPAAGKPLWLEALVQFSEANTDDANVAVGLASGVAADLITDNGGGMRASGAVIALYKVDGETAWRFVTRNGTAVTVSQSQTPAGGAAPQRLSIEVLDGYGSIATVVPLVDSQHLRDATDPTRIVRHQMDLAGLANLQAFAGVKNGGASLETLNVDYLGVAQAR